MKVISGLVIVILLVVIYCVLGVFATAKELAGRGTSKGSSDAASLRGVANACFNWAEKNDWQMPDHVGRLLLGENRMSTKLLVSRRAGVTESLVMTRELERLAERDFEAFAKIVDEHCDIVYLGKGTKNSSDANVLVAFEKPHRHMSYGINMAFEDVHVDYVLYKQVRKILEEANVYREKHGLSAIDIDAVLRDAPGK